MPDAAAKHIVPALLLIACLAASGCSFQLPKIHRVTVQQGNVITQEMVDRLKPGMTPEQVAFVMGGPVVRNAFDNSRWDYVYTLEVPKTFQSRVIVSIFFEDDQLVRIIGDLKPSEADAADEGA